MKRFLLAGLMLFCGINAVFAECKPEPCDTSWGNDVIGVERLETSGDGESRCYVCESDYCGDGDVVVGPYIDNFKVCKHGLDDSWESYEPMLCKDRQGTAALQYIKGAYKVYNINGTEYKSGVKGGMSVPVVISGQVICYYYKCPDGTHPDIEKGECVVSVGKSVEPQEEEKAPKSKTCVETKCSALSGAKYNECVACCSVSSNVAKWNGQTCNCVEYGKKFDVNSKKCVVPGGGRADDVDCSVFFNQITSLQAQCNGNTIVLEKISELKARCDSGDLSMDAFYDSWGDLQKLILEYCKPAPVVTDDPASRNNIIAAGGVLDGIVSGFDVSVWKDQEGNFNTARLASDSIAGVVLGTAGGLISSHVIKKSQIKKGFEDIQCVIAGQPVAGWGDLFQVGIQ